jgi:hypothetical protein
MDPFSAGLSMHPDKTTKTTTSKKTVFLIMAR